MHAHAAVMRARTQLALQRGLPVRGSVQLVRLRINPQSARANAVGVREDAAKLFLTCYFLLVNYLIVN